MPTDHLVPEDLRRLYHVREWRNAAGVLLTACPDEWADIVAVLRGFRLLRSQILTAGRRAVADFPGHQRRLRGAGLAREGLRHAHRGR